MARLTQQVDVARTAASGTRRIGHPGSRPRPIVKIVERAYADPEHQASGSALRHPFHRHCDSAPFLAVRRDQAAYSLRERITNKTFNVTNQHGAERDLCTDELRVSGVGGSRGCDDLGVCLQESAFPGERAAAPHQLNRIGKRLHDWFGRGAGSTEGFNFILTFC
jgi:hypothetical protein